MFNFNFNWRQLAIAVKPIFSAILRGAAAVTACQLCYYLTTKPADGAGWVETPTEELVKVSGLSRYQVENSRRKLVALGLLEEVRRYGNKIWSRPTGKRVTVVKYTIQYQLGNGKTRTVERFKCFPEGTPTETIEAAVPKASSITIQGHYTLLELYSNTNTLIEEPPQSPVEPSVTKAPIEKPSVEPPKPPIETVSDILPTPTAGSTERASRLEPTQEPSASYRVPIAPVEPPKPPIETVKTEDYYTTNQHPCERVNDRFKRGGEIPEWKKSRSPQDYTDEAIESVMGYLGSFSKDTKDPSLRKRAISHLYRLEKENRFAEIREILKTYKFNKFTSKIPEKFREVYPYYLIYREVNAGRLANDHPDFVKLMLAPSHIHHLLDVKEKELEKLYENLTAEGFQT
jgi:hypothetical protein